MADKYPNGKGKPGRKRKWKDMCITRVKLNPEQAVLTCCEQPTKLQSFPPNYSCDQPSCSVSGQAAYSS